MDDNVDINNNNSETTINLLLQLLANPKILQQATTMITQQTPSAPNPVSIAAATSLTGVVNTSFPRGSIQNPITKEEWKQWKKIKQPNEDWKDFLHLPYDTYWTYRRNLRDRLNATCEKGKYASEQVPGKIQNVINSFKSDFPTFPISVGDFVLQKIIEDIVGNWETNNTDNIDVQLTHVTPSDVQEELEDTRNVQLYTHETPSNGNEKRTTTTRTRLEKTIRPPKKQSTTRKTYNTRNKSQK
ncbi:14038_t:CDS:2 [Rhizophagus irregularis]|nr:14038_t:CDS:2 [Rhizophagus irregularis]